MDEHKNKSDKSKTNNKNDQLLTAKILGLLKKEKSALAKNQIARLLGLSSDEQIDLKNALRQLCMDEKITKGERRRYSLIHQEWAPDMVFVATVDHISNDGDLELTPVKNITAGSSLNLDQKIIVPFESYKRVPGSIRNATIGTLTLIKLIDCDEGFWQAKVLRFLKKPSARPTTSFIGVIIKDNKSTYIYPTDRRQNNNKPVLISDSALQNFPHPIEHHDVVVFENDANQNMRVIEKLGTIDDPKTFISMAVHTHKLPHTFPNDVLKDANKSQPPVLGNREDMRTIPFVTIDGEDAKDFDDAVWASPVYENEDTKTVKHWRLIVAIADVSHYVRPDTPMDAQARLRGNSVYFPNGVIPMLPEFLSNGLCSLKPNEDRACLAIDMKISIDGKIISYTLKRVLICSFARLTYKQVQQYLDAKLEMFTKKELEILESTIPVLNDVYKALRHNRDERGALDIESSERKVVFNADGHVDKIVPYERWDSNQIIEECMIAANVCAAKLLEKKKSICVYRIHDRPDALKVQNLRQFSNHLKLTFPKTTKPTPDHFNALLHASRKTPYKHLINDLVLRSQSQAQYSTKNVGHFGLGLNQYAHFTSPIRRYSDLILHRLLLEAYGLGEEVEFQPKKDAIEETCQHLCSTERLAIVAERDVMDRFMGHFYANDVGKVFPVVIVGVTNAGLFVSHSISGAQGFIPKRSLPDDMYSFDQSFHRLVGRRTRKTFQLGDYLDAKLIVADIFTANLVFEIENNHQEKKVKKSYSKDKNVDAKKHKNWKKKKQFNPKKQSRKSDKKDY